MNTANILNRNRGIVKIILLVAAILALLSPSEAQIEIKDFFSDFTTSDVTINSTQDFNGKAVFELSYAGTLVETHEVPFDMKAGSSVTKVILWEKKPQQDYYTAKVRILDDSRTLSSKSYQVSYGTVSLPSFHVVDFSPTNTGVQLLLQPFNPVSVDVKIELLNNNDIIYTKINDNLYLTSIQQITMAWPFLLERDKKYPVRAKIYSHRLNAEPLINTYVSFFTASDDVEILPDDVEVDEYGASVTLRGKSQVPFDGAIIVNARNRATGDNTTYRQVLEEILVSGKEDTAGVVWRGLKPGTYDVEIRAMNKENVTVDKYETVMRIPEPPATAVTNAASRTPGFGALLVIIALFAMGRHLKGG